ncbi:MAG: pyruvate kinase, partial [Planctomycetota bacterium]
MWNDRESANAKILATLGPASERPDVVRALAEAGADAFRLNFSHGEPSWHADTVNTIRDVAGRHAVALLADLQGPRIRVGQLDRFVEIADADARPLQVSEDGDGRPAGHVADGVHGGGVPARLAVREVGE